MLACQELKIDSEKVRKRYNDIKDIWNKEDMWHGYTRWRIHRFLQFFFRDKPVEGCKLLNAGSGGNDYGLNDIEQFHVDIAESKIKHFSNSLISNIERMPIKNDEFDYCLCVGSVINYCDAAAVIQEFRRVLKQDGYLILEFEGSKSFEFIFKSSFDRTASIAETFYQGSVEQIWIYSERYLKSLLQDNGFRILMVERFHIFSPIVYRMSKNPNLAARFVRLDLVANFIPVLRTFAANIILTCVKVS